MLNIVWKAGQRLVFQCNSQTFASEQDSEAGMGACGLRARREESEHYLQFQMNLWNAHKLKLHEIG